MRSHSPLHLQYPQSKPLVSIERARGLSDENIAVLLSQVDQMVTANAHAPVLYDVIQLCRDYLADHDQLHFTCAICFDGFSRSERPFATACVHYFHAHCFGRYWHTRSDELHAQCQSLPRPEQHKFDVVPRCPVCRAQLVLSSAESIAILSASAVDDAAEMQPSTSAGVISTVDESLVRQWREHQQAMTDVYRRQMDNGGIIDPTVSRQIGMHIDENTVAIEVATTTESSNAPSTIANDISQSVAKCEHEDEPGVSVRLQNRPHKSNGARGI